MLQAESGAALLKELVAFWLHSHMCRVNPACELAGATAEEQQAAGGSYELYRRYLWAGSSTVMHWDLHSSCGVMMNQLIAGLQVLGYRSSGHGL